MRKDLSLVLLPRGGGCDTLAFACDRQLVYRLRPQCRTRLGATRIDSCAGACKCAWAAAASTQVAGRLGVGANLPLSCVGVGVGGLLPPARLESSKSLQMYLHPPVRVRSPPVASSSGAERASARPPLSVAVTPLHVRGG